MTRCFHPSNCIAFLPRNIRVIQGYHLFYSSSFIELIVKCPQMLTQVTQYQQLLPLIYCHLYKHKFFRPRTMNKDKMRKFPCTCFLYFITVASCLLLVFLVTKLYHIKDANVCFVETLNGRLVGTLRTFANSDVCEFLGIPYAVPPTGNLRFAKPLPIGNWTVVKNTTKFGPRCMQHVPQWAGYMMTPTVNEMDEDCLSLNIWMPITDANAPKAALFWIHGGGYQFGSGSLDETHGGVLAATGNVIVVTLNYRLNAFGFLNLQTDNAPGNMGLYDQALALTWLSKNIYKFGGDYEQITLWGQGMGSLSISAHLVSPFTRNLFKRAILQTGSIFTSPTMYSQYEQVAEQLVSLVGCGQAEGDNGTADNGTDVTAILNCLRTVPPETIVAAVSQMNVLNPISFLFSPDEEYFDYLSPSELRADLQAFTSNTSKSFLVGFNSDEGSLLLHSMLSAQYPTNSTPVNVSLSDSRAILMELFEKRFKVPAAIIQTGINSALKEAVASSISFTKTIYDFVGHNVFVCPTIVFAEEMSKEPLTNSVHMFHYSRRTSYNRLPKWFGTIQNEEVPIMFGYPLRYPALFTQEEQKFSQRLMRTISTFAKTG